MSKLYCATKVLWLYSMIFLGGCSIYSIPGTEPAPVEPEPVYTPVEPVTEATKPELEPAEPEPDTSSAYKGLLNKANSAAARGDYEQALALLERAQRIDPDAGEIYLSLAKTYRAKGDDSLAAATAERGMLYCDGLLQCEALRAYLR
ncbi:MAG: tetratricopeptide (TPR) repeat protein [Halioglobus sp.]|jgi:tetratricopeptide (TPR) repeat protein